MFATYTGNGAGQVNVADMVTGSLRYMFNGTENLQFGDTQSSVAVDKEGCTSMVVLAMHVGARRALYYRGFMTPPLSLDCSVRFSCRPVCCQRVSPRTRQRACVLVSGYHAQRAALGSVRWR